MTAAGYLDLVDVSTGSVLVCAVITLWRRDLRAIVAVLALQGVALSALAAVLAIHTHDLSLGVVSVGVLAVKGIIIPKLLARIARDDPGSRETAPLVNVPSSLVAAAALIIVAYVSAHTLTSLFPNATSRLAPLGLATVLLGFFLLVTRRKAVSQIVGLLLIDNGVALVAFLLTSGVPILIEFGASLDLLLVVAVLQVLATTMHARFGHIDLDQLRELHD